MEWQAEEGNKITRNKIKKLQNALIEMILLLASELSKEDS